jgi:hypothetical protein
MLEKIELTSHYAYKTNILQSYNNELIEEIVNASKKFENDKVSNIGGWQSEKLNGYDKKFHYMSKFIYDNYDKIIAYCKNINDNTTLDIGNIWGNLNKKGHYNSLHGHKGLIVGCYYAQMPEEIAPMIVLDEENLHELYCKTGDLILFDAKLKHAVEPNLSNTDRISLAFNVETNWNVSKDYWKE